MYLLLSSSIGERKSQLFQVYFLKHSKDLKILRVAQILSLLNIEKMTFIKQQQQLPLGHCPSDSNSTSCFLPQAVIPMMHLLA